MRLARWIDEVKATGGIPDEEREVLAAFDSAVVLCWAEIKNMRVAPSQESSKTGVNWVAAFMVSCAKHGDTDFCSTLLESNDRQEIFRLEAQKNTGMIAMHLNAAAGSSPRMFGLVLYLAGAHIVGPANSSHRPSDP